MVQFPPKFMINVTILITRRFVICLALCYFVIVFFSLFSIATTSIGEERASLGAFRKFMRFALV